MRRIFLLFFSIIILFVSFVPLQTVNAVDSYRVVVLDDTGTIEDLGTFDNYKEAYQKMNEYESTLQKVAVLYKNGTLVNAAYAFVNVKRKYDSAGRVSLTQVYNNPALTGTRYTYLDGAYGSDAAFLEYNNEYNTVKLKISGYSGWVSLSDVDIIPLSQLYNKYIKVNVLGLRIRTSPDTTDSTNILSTATEGVIYQFYEIKEDENYKWYRIKYNGEDAWLAHLKDSNWLTEYSGIGLKTYYSVYEQTGNLLHYFRYNNDTSMTYINLGISPSFLKANTIYYSFDGNYFYTDLLKMLADYKNGTFENSLNYKTPYYNYYQYLPNHTKSGYTAENLDKYIEDAGFTGSPDSMITYVDESGNWVNGVNRTGLSQMYGTGAFFIASQEKYGVNALLTFSTALNESATGTSKIAFAKNNLFGHGAADACPFECAKTYDTVEESIMYHAQMTGTGYNNPNYRYYYGSHYGNKGSGMNVNYASDPYWGEKSAANAYSRDMKYGGQDYMVNTIGIKMSDAVVPIKKEASDTSSTIYELKNKVYNHLVSNIPLTVFDKVYDANKVGWYLVYTDVALDENQDISSSSEYSFLQSYGYIKEEYLYVSNNQPQIIANNLSLEQGQPYDLRKGVEASDIEDGDLTLKIEYVDNVDITKVGTYEVTYEVTDSMNFSVHKTVTVEVYKGKTPTIVASNREVLANTEFDPMSGVTATDPTDGNITENIEIINNTVDITKVGTYEITYKIVNSLHLEVTKTISVKVLSNAFPILQANDITSYINTEINFLNGVVASDLEDGDLTNKIVIEKNTVDITKAGTYKIIYSVTDSNKNKVTKEICVTIEDIIYESKTGDFYFYTMKWNNDKNLLEVSGSLAILGIDNTKDTPIQYDFIFYNNENKNEIIMPLKRFLENHPVRTISDTNYKYTETWFQGSLDLSKIPKGEYTLYVRARSKTYEAKTLFNNLFLKDAVKKVVDINGRGYLFRNNNYKREFPLELIIENSGLISVIESTHPANMFNSYKTISFDGEYLKIVGNSFNMGGSYGKNDSVTRTFILENKLTEERFVYDIGSILGDEILLKTDDGFSNVRSWYDTEEKVSIKDLPVGTYILYLHTTSGKIDDFGELQDLFLTANHKSTMMNGKTYTLTVNQNARYRVELIVK